MNFCDETITVTPRKCQCYPYLIPVILEAFRVSLRLAPITRSKLFLPSPVLQSRSRNQIVQYCLDEEDRQAEDGRRSCEVSRNYRFNRSLLLNFFEEQIPSTNLMSRALCMSQNFPSFFQFQPKYSASRTELEYYE